MLAKATYNNTDSFLVNYDLIKIILETMYEKFSDTVDGSDADAETELAAAHVATELYERGGKNFCRSRVNSGSKSASESEREGNKVDGHI